MTKDESEHIDIDDRLSEADAEAVPYTERPIDRVCLPVVETLKTLKNKRTTSKCFDGIDVRARRRSRSVLLALIESFPELGDEFDSLFRQLGIKTLVSIGALKGEEVRARALKILVEALTTRVSPVDGRKYDTRESVTFDEWRDIRRMAMGQDPTGERDYTIRLSRADRETLSSALRTAIVNARRVGTPDEVRCLERIYGRFSPKGK